MLSTVSTRISRKGTLKKFFAEKGIGGSAGEDDAQIER